MGSIDQRLVVLKLVDLGEEMRARIKGTWSPTPEPEHPQVREVTGEPKAHFYAVTPEAVRTLTEFLQATNWNCIYGIGMGTNTPARAAEGAAFVAETLSDRLQYF